VNDAASDVKWAKYAALGGPLFVLANIVAGALTGTPPDTDASAEEIADYFADKPGQIQASVLVGVLAAIPLAWWFGSLWRRMARAEDGRPRMAVVALIGLVLAGGLAMAGNAVFGALAFRVQDAGPGVTSVLYVLSFGFISANLVGLVIFLAAVTSLSFRTRIFPAWSNWVGWLAALLSLVGTLSLVNDDMALAQVGFAGFILFGIWLLAVSWVMWKDPA
jgi:hypothetical protein